MGFDFPPDVTVQGGVHYLRLIEEDSARNGKFYKISANTDRSISLSNTFSEDLSLVFPANSMIEVFQAWTLGDLFGYDSVKLQSGNSLTADIIYILKEPSMQHGDSAYDYVGYFHDGTGWRQGEWRWIVGRQCLYNSWACFSFSSLVILMIWI